MRRKLLCVSASTAFGIWLAGISIYAAAGIALAAFLYASILYVRADLDQARISKIALACAVAVTLGSARMLIEEARYPAVPSILYNDDKVTIMTGEVLEVKHKNNYGNDGFAITIRLIRCGKIPCKGINIHKCLVSYFPNDKDGSKTDLLDLSKLIGTVIQFHGKLSVPDGSRNPRCFNYRSYLKGLGIAYISSTKSYEVINNKAGGITAVLKRKILQTRELFIRYISSFEKDETVTAFYRGILFGDTSYLPDDISEDFRTNGTAHILAVSGLHIGLLYSIFRMIRKNMRIPGITVLFVLALFSYGTMALWSVSVTRAVVMIIIMELGDHLDRRYDLLTSLGMVSMLSLISNPYVLYSSSFMLSYIAVLSLGIIGPVIEQKTKGVIPGSIRSSLAVQAGLLPYTAYTFNNLPIGAALINIPVVAIMSLVMTLTMSILPMTLISVLFSLDPAILRSIFIPVICLIKSVIRLNRIFADIGFFSIDVVSPPLPFIFAVYGIMFLVCSENFRIEKMRQNFKIVQIEAGILLIVTLLSCFTGSSGFDRAEIIMVDVGQGDCIHIRSCGRNYLIDGGGSADVEVGRKTLRPYLLKNGVSHINAAIVTHLHTDHYKGICELAKEGMVDRLFVYEANHLKIKEIQKDTGLNTDRITFIRKGHRITLGSRSKRTDTLEVLWPPQYTDEKYSKLVSDEADENESCLIMKVTINGISLIATGDLGEEGEQELMRSYDSMVQLGVLHADILKVGHHGSRTSSCGEFIDAVHPKFAVVQVGKNNTYGHPAPETISRFSSRRIKVLRNDTDGAVGFIINKKNIEKVESMRNYG